MPMSGEYRVGSGEPSTSSPKVPAGRPPWPVWRSGTIASDITVGTTTMYADYIFPDVSYLERWEFGGSQPSITFKVQGVRNPVIAPLTGTVKVYGQEMAFQWEAMLLAIAEKMELPNFGPNGLGEGVDYTHPDDLYLRMVMNLAYGEKKDLEDAVTALQALGTRQTIGKVVLTI